MCTDSEPDLEQALLAGQLFTADWLANMPAEEYDSGDAPATAPATSHPAIEPSKVSSPCITDQELDVFHLLMTDRDYPNNKKLLNAVQRVELISTLERSDFRPNWLDTKDPKSVARFNKLKFDAKHKYYLQKGQLYRVVDSKDVETDTLRRQAFVYDAGSIIADCHKATGHAGEDKTYAYISKRYYGISKESKKQLLKQCVTCVKMAPNKTRLHYSQSMLKRR